MGLGGIKGRESPLGPRDVRGCVFKERACLERSHVWTHEGRGDTPSGRREARDHMSTGGEGVSFRIQ